MLPTSILNMKYFIINVQTIFVDFIILDQFAYFARQQCGVPAASAASYGYSEHGEQCSHRRQVGHSRQAAVWIRQACTSNNSWT